MEIENVLPNINCLFAPDEFENTDQKTIQTSTRKMHLEILRFKRNTKKKKAVKGKH